MSTAVHVTPNPPPLPAKSAPTGRDVSEVGSWLLGTLFGGVLGVGIVANGFDEHPRAMWISLATQYCSLGILPFVAWRARRPALYLAAGVVGMIVPFFLMSVIGLPLLIPAAMSLVAYDRRAGDVQGKLSDPAIAMLALALVMAAFVSLFVHQDPQCRTRPNFSMCSNNIVTPVEGLVSLGFSLSSIVMPILLAAPSRQKRPSPGSRP